MPVIAGTEMLLAAWQGCRIKRFEHLFLDSLMIEIEMKSQY